MEPVRSSTPALSIEDLTVQWGSTLVLERISLQVSEGESVAIMGKSGSGKTTLLNCILGIATPQSGTIRIHGEPVKPGLSRKSAQHRRERIGMVFQAGYLLQELSPTENIAIAGLLAGMDSRTATERANALLVHLGVDVSKRSIAEYSGGEQQRIAVARALINDPPLVIADEPTGSLDPETRDTVADLLFTLPATIGCALVVVTHDPDVAQRADRIQRLTKGQFVSPRVTTS